MNRNNMKLRDRTSRACYQPLTKVSKPPRKRRQSRKFKNVTIALNPCLPGPSTLERPDADFIHVKASVGERDVSYHIHGRINRAKSGAKTYVYTQTNETEISHQFYAVKENKNGTETTVDLGTVMVGVIKPICKPQRIEKRRLAIDSDLPAPIIEVDETAVTAQ